MPEPRHPHRRLSAPVRISLVITVALVFAVGCYQEPTPPKQFVPGDPLYEQFTTAGDRLLIEGPDGQPVMKIRQRRRDTRVYDAHMRPLGRVIVGDDTDLTLHRLRSSEPESVDQTEGTVTLEGAWRLEEAGEDRWDLFDGDGQLIALWRRDAEGHWTLRRTDGDATALRAEIDEHSATVIDRSGNQHLRVTTTRWSTPKLLALTLDPLDPLHRYALAEWIDQNF